MLKSLMLKFLLLKSLMLNFLRLVSKLYSFNFEMFNNNSNRVCKILIN